MTLLLAHARLLANPLQCSSLRRSLPAVRHRSVFRCCAVSVDGGGLEDSRDGGLVAASDGAAAPRVTNSAAAKQNHAPAGADSSGPESRAGEAPATPAWIVRAESTIERVWLPLRGFETAYAFSNVQRHHVLNDKLLFCADHFRFPVPHSDGDCRFTPRVSPLFPQGHNLT
jgi:hypothetical protein